ncbi:MAG: hypoxanthine phosphoribosyltransferase [bacterium]
MKQVTLKDKTFGISIDESKILESIEVIAAQMCEELRDKNPLFLVILNGAFMFAADLLKRVEIPAEVSFIKVASYEGTGSTGTIKELLGLTDDVKGRTVVIIEDIVDSGFTMSNIIKQLTEKGADDIRVATLFFKPEALKHEVKLNYVAMTIPNDFIVGYGLDYDGYGRNLRDIYTLIP